MEMDTLDNDRAVIGGNSPPDPIDEALSPFGDTISEAENWLDGASVETEAQMHAMDTLIKGVKAARKAVDDARDTATKPLHEAWKAEVARWKPTQDDLDRIVKGLVAAIDNFKRKLAAEKAAREAALRADAEAKLRAAQEAHRAANPADIEATRAAAEAERAAEDARIRAAVAAKDTVKGMRTVDVTEVLDATAYARWLWANDRTALVDWMTEHARKSKHNIPGVVETRKDRRAA
jgi:Sec-independent protein translocase protein TatA